MNFLYDIFSYHWEFVLLSSLYIALECFFPIIKDRKFFREEFGQDVFWYFFNNVFVDKWYYYVVTYISLNIFPKIGRSLLTSISPDSWTWLQMFPLHIESKLLLGIIVFLLIDFLAYWLHYLNHRIPFLWSFHILHHSPRKLDWLSGTRAYWVDGILSSMMPSLVLIFFHVEEAGLTLLALWGTHLQLFIHANTRLRLGPLEKVFNNPHAHWWHHDIRCHHPYGQNFGESTVIWDKLFNTYYIEKGYPQELGLSEKLNYPAGIVGRLLYPLRQVQFFFRRFDYREDIESDLIKPRE